MLEVQLEHLGFNPVWFFIDSRSWDELKAIYRKQAQVLNADFRTFEVFYREQTSEAWKELQL